MTWTSNCLGVITQIVKVKSHIGIKGTEKADRLADKAVHESSQDMVNIGGAFDGLFWPGKIPPPMDNAGELYLLSNLNKATKDAAWPSLQTGNSN